MSTDPTGLENDTCIESTRKQYINIKFGRDDWCTYSGECMIGDTLHYPPEDLCLLCSYRSPIDIPSLLNEHRKERIVES